MCRVRVDEWNRLQGEFDADPVVLRGSGIAERGDEGGAPFDLGSDGCLVGGVADQPARRCAVKDLPRRRARNCRRSLKEWSVGWSGGRWSRPRTLRVGWEREGIGQLRPVRRGGANDRKLRDMADSRFPACEECSGAIEELYL